MSTATEMPARDWVAGTWTIDAVHSHVGFMIKHMMVSKVRGHFGTFSGTIVTGATPDTSSVEATIEATSINTGNPMRDDHVRSADFFDAAEHPQLTFRSTGVRLVEGDFLIDGDLTIRGVTQPVTLTMGPPEFGPGMEEGTGKAGFSATTEIVRHDFGVSYNGPIPGGGAALGDKVSIELEIEADLVSEAESRS
ncbi:MAG: YceI family protein [Actinobacteria bacterium]|jgi:polyisoprenoid-binding protein YceI|nr:YceI family protein [Actinomycetota bacterium]